MGTARLLTFLLAGAFAATALTTRPVRAWQDDDEPSVGELMEEAGDQIQQANYAAAAKTLRKVVERDKENGRAWQLLGYSLHLDGKLDEAIKAHTKATEFDDVRGIALYNLGCAYSLKKDSDQAFTYLEKAVKQGFKQLNFYETDTDLDHLRKDARFARIIKLVKGEEVDPEFDAAKLVGTWTYVSGRRAGTEVPAERLVGEVTVTKETFTLPVGPDEKFVMKYSLDAKKPPVTIDMEIKSGPVNEGSAVGIIKLADNDSLILCYDSTGQKRPEKFESTPENGFFMFTLKRKAAN